MLAIWIFVSLVAIIQAAMEGFIVGGEYTTINRYPHSAFLTVACVLPPPTNCRLSWICGSSIINQKILLTAGHCVYTCEAGTRIFVNMGDAYRHGGIIRSASGYILHEKYNPDNSACDIGLIKMAKPVDFNDRISRVAIMSKPPYNEPAHLAGWGMIDEYTKAQGIKLKAVDQNVWRHSSCQRMFGELPKGTICASSKNTHDFAAQGDSGAGLVVRGYIQIGLVSYKIPTVANNVIIYTDVGFYYDWIDFHVHRLFCTDDAEL